MSDEIRRRGGGGGGGRVKERKWSSTAEQEEREKKRERERGRKKKTEVSFVHSFIPAWDEKERVRDAKEKRAPPLRLFFSFFFPPLQRWE